MIADADLNITYVNLALVSFLRNVEADIREDLPAFNIETLVGTNIDIFYKNPVHQRGVLKKLSETFKTSITVGGHVFGLFASPLESEDGVRMGTVVEWSDTEVLDNAGQVAAINKSQEVIEFELDGTIINANENFCRALGYSLSEIQGKHHSMFLDSEYKNSQEYKQFWIDLGEGQYQSGQYKCFGNGGKEVWIEASYNPIMDLNGRPFKVVKYATDVTAQIQLMEEVKKLVDKNVGEIERAAVIANEQAVAGANASEQTSHNVQAVASGAEELSASVREIAESMAKSREASEVAFASVEAADKATQALSDAANAMGGIVDMIQGIAGQINLLALNATIESARAGEAGKGFAVVASEVKNLSRQATEATDEISKEIQGVQAVSGEVVTALASIKTSIESVRDFVTNTASAVEEQSAVAGEMSSNMQQAASAVSGVSENISQIAEAVKGVDEATQKTKEAAKVLAR
jgi:PAS domain S-box-containing protein